jgi:hypothetical protein
MTDLIGADWPVPPDFVELMRATARRAKSVGILAITFGVFALVYTFGMVATGHSGTINMTKMGFMSAGAIGVGVGLGLLNYSAAARTAGAAWFLAWGFLNLVAGFASVLSHDAALGIFALVSGIIHLFFSAALSSPNVVFLFEYVGGAVTADEVRGALRAAMLGGTPEMQMFANAVVNPVPPLPLEGPGRR